MHPSRRVRADRWRSCGWLSVISVLCFAGSLSGAAAISENPIGKCAAANYDGYSVRNIEIRNPFDFLPFVNRRMRELKSTLPIAKTKVFTGKDYDDSYAVLQKALLTDNTFGNSPVTVKVIADQIENCSDETKSIDIVYRVLLIDPSRFLNPTPEVRVASVHAPAVTTAEEAAKPRYIIQPLFGYDRALRGFGGGDVKLEIPGNVLDDFQLSAFGSSSSRDIRAILDAERHPGLSAIDRITYRLGYHYADLPASTLQLAGADLHLQILAYAKPRRSGPATMTFRYGGSIEGGHQQTRGMAANAPAGTVADSSRAALRLYGGLTDISRYSETAVSYAFEAGGDGPGSIGFTKHIADVLYSRRFPAATHSPSDVQMRFTWGGINGSSGLPLSDRFFGGSALRSFVPDDPWQIPIGPIVRSIPSNRLSGMGFGGTAFYSANLTYGKVLKSWPIIPREIDTQGFRDSIEAGENSAEQFIREEYENAAPDFTRLIAEQSRVLSDDMNSAEEILTAIRAEPGMSPAVRRALIKAEAQKKLAENIIRHATVPASITGRLNPSGLKTFVGPKSKLTTLIDSLAELRSLAPGFAVRLDAAIASIGGHQKDLAAAINAFDNSPAAKQAIARAHDDMRRPREVIETLRTEVNSRSFGLVGITDVGRLWPDPYGSRYAFGAGARFSLVNINATLGYAVNPNPRKELGQGRGAFFFSLTYTNLFQ